MDDDLNQQEPKVQADNNSIAIGGISIGGNVSGNIAIGNTGYTSEEVSVLITQIKSTFQLKPFDGRCPYKGLDVFEEEDAELFFGREKLVDDLVNRVKESRTIFITGPSGSGKSSLVRAGLIHALKQGAIKESKSERWLYATCKPGRDPLEALKNVFSRLKTPELGNYFQQNISKAGVLHECAEAVLSERKDQRLVLFIDQFEEVFTQISSEDERVTLLNLLTHAVTVENGRVIILFSMRSDFVSNCATYPELNALLNQQFIQIGAMQPEELVSAIAQPALRVGLPIDPDLIAQIINDMRGEPGALPLMQFALKDLFDAQHEKGGVIALTSNDYLQRGGIHKSLERHADKTFAKFNTEEQELARSIFSGLIEIGRGTQDTRRTALFEELIPANTNESEVEEIVQKLADARLITTDEQAGKDTITISHEKLIDAWPWLRKLVNENREVIALQNEINSDAKEWEEHKRDTSYLYTGARLVNADEQAKKQNLNLNQLAKEFVRVSQAVKRRSQKLIFSGVSVVLIVSIITSIIFKNQTEEAQKLAGIALARQLALQSQSIFAAKDIRLQTAVLLAIQSMKIFPTGDAASILQSNVLKKINTHIILESNIFYAFAPNNKYIVSGSDDGIVQVWDIQTGAEISRMTYEGTVPSVAISPNGKYIVSGSDDGIIRIWDIQTGVEISRMTHEGRVYSISISPDGKHVVSDSGDGIIRIWDIQTGVEISRVTYEGSIPSVAISPDGKYVVSGSADGIAHVWDIQTGVEISRMTHKTGVVSVAISPDGKYVVSGSVDGIAHVWDIQTGVEISHMIHTGWALNASFSPDGKYIISRGGLNETIYIWEAQTGVEIAQKDGVSEVDLSPDGKYIVLGSLDGTARVWEAQTGVEISRMQHQEWVTSVAFSPDEKYVISGSKDGTARIWETQTGVEISRMIHEGRVSSVAFSPDGKYVISGSDHGTARVWEAQPKFEISRMTHEGSVDSISISPDGKYVVSGSDNGIVQVWDIQTGVEISRMIHQDSVTSVTSVAFSPDGKYVVSHGRDGTVQIWDIQTGAEISRMTHEGRMSSVAFSPDGKYVVSGSDDGIAHVWDIQTGAEISRMTHEGRVSGVAFSPDGKYVVSHGSYDGIAHVWDIQTGVEISRMTHEGSIGSISISPDGKYVVSANYDGTVRIWDIQKGVEISRVTYEGSVPSVAISPDGKYIVSGSADGIAHVWDIQTGAEISRMTHEGRVSSVAFSPDGKYVVSGSDDGIAHVWDIQTGVEISRMIHEGRVSGVAFSPDGKYVVSGSVDKTVRVWIWQANDLIADACLRVTNNLTQIEWEKYIGNVLPYQAVCPNLPIETEVIITPTP